MTKRLTQLLFILTIIMVPALAAVPADKDGRKQMKNIHEQLKNNKANDALNTIEKLGKDSLYEWDAQRLQYAVEAHIMLNDKENEKFYLKSKPDTTALLSTTYNLIHYILLTDSAERLAAVEADKVVFDQQGRLEAQKYRYRKQNKETLARALRNFKGAPKFFSAHANWAETQRYAELYINLATSPIARSFNKPLIDSTSVCNMAVTHLNACYKQKKFEDIERFAYIALHDSATRESTLEKLAYSEIERGDSMSYKMRLQYGHWLYPSNMFFFSRLIDVYLHNGNSQAVLNTANETLESVLNAAQDEAQFCVIDTLGDYDKPSDAQALNGVRSSVSLPDEQIAQIFEARAIAHHNNGDSRACIEDAENILSWNPNHPRADFYIGASYYSIAEGIDVPGLVSAPSYQQAVRERNRFLTLARPHLEAYRRCSPNDSDIWAPLLYDTYLYLNLGPEFEEISQYIH